MSYHDRVHNRRVITLSERIFGVAFGVLIGAVLTAFTIDIMKHRAVAASARPAIIEVGEPRINIPQTNLREVGLNIDLPEFDNFYTFSQTDVHCLAHAIYYEARGEKFIGMLAVANVVMNRVSDPRYPKTVCEVTRQRSRTSCQFEYYCKVGDRIPHIDDPQWQMANDIAFQVLDNNLPDLTDGAIRFHAIAGNSIRGALRIGSHVFYRR